MVETLQTVQTTNGNSVVMLYDSEYEGKMLPEYFDPDFWQTKPETKILAHGRGVTLKVQSEHASSAWVLRQYFRGGLIGRFVKQSYFYSRETAIRSFAEWRVTRKLHAQNLPVPKPIAAMYMRTGLTYKAAILIQYIPHTKTLSQLLQGTGTINWAAIAEAIYVLHNAGLVHSDLNAYNILIHQDDKVTIIDLDKSGYHPGLILTASHRESLNRLQRSILKVSRRGPELIQKDWSEFIQAYRKLSAS